MKKYRLKKNVTYTEFVNKNNLIKDIDSKADYDLIKNRDEFSVIYGELKAGDNRSFYSYDEDNILKVADVVEEPDMVEDFEKSLKEPVTAESIMEHHDYKQDDINEPREIDAYLAVKIIKQVDEVSAVDFYKYITKK